MVASTPTNTSAIALVGDLTTVVCAEYGGFRLGSHDSSYEKVGNACGPHTQGFLVLDRRPMWPSIRPSMDGYHNCS